MRVAAGVLACLFLHLPWQRVPEERAGLVGSGTPDPTSPNTPAQRLWPERALQLMECICQASSLQGRFTKLHPPPLQGLLLICSPPWPH